MIIHAQWNAVHYRQVTRNNKEMKEEMTSLEKSRTARGDYVDMCNQIHLNKGTQT